MEKNRIHLAAGIAGLLVFCVYAWFISIGPWRSRGYTSDYYSQLAASFQHGQLALETMPDPALLALPDPYDHKARKTVPVLGDASLYEGRYYLYFGPLPALMLAGLDSIIPVKTGDQAFVYLFIGGIFLLQSLLFIVVVRHFFSDLPEWIIPLGVLVLGFIGPSSRLLTHPFIHEAAVSGGQFFFVAGFYFAFLALKDKPFSNLKLMLASIFWACSIATRITQLAPVSVMVVITWLFIFHEARKGNAGMKIGAATLTLVAPLLVTGMLLGWYNWARFDSIFEFGLYYQLAGFNIQANYSALSSPAYVLQNLYNYFVNPFELRGEFPFAYPLAGSETPIFSFYRVPGLYAVEGKFAGLLSSRPFLLLAILPMLLLAGSVRKAPDTTYQKENTSGFLNWTVSALVGAFVAACIPMLLYFYAGIRFELEFAASLTMLSLIGFCQGYTLTNNMPVQKLFTACSIGLAVLSMLVSLALAFTGRMG